MRGGTRLLVTGRAGHGVRIGSCAIALALGGLLATAPPVVATSGSVSILAFRLNPPQRSADEAALRSEYSKVSGELYAALMNHSCAKDLPGLYSQLAAATSMLDNIDSSYGVMLDVYYSLDSSTLADLGIMAADVNAIAGSLVAAYAGLGPAEAALTAVGTPAARAALGAVTSLAGILQTERSAAAAGTHTYEDTITDVANGASAFAAIVDPIANEGRASLGAAGGALVSFASAITSLTSLINNYKTAARDAGALANAYAQAAGLYDANLARLGAILAGLEAGLAACRQVPPPIVVQSQSVSVPKQASINFSYCNGLVCGNSENADCVSNLWMPQFEGSVPPVLTFEPPYPGARVLSVEISAGDGGPPTAYSYASGADWSGWNPELSASVPAVSADGALRIALGGSSVGDDPLLLSRHEYGITCGLSDDQYKAFLAKYGSTFVNTYTQETVTVVWGPPGSVPSVWGPTGSPPNSAPTTSVSPVTPMGAW
ncbi:MAG TPA: hypothetical protein VED84_01060 [Acidimicrobiales bacterium]|nr:hypothetical protein [Acidimicrobiales bacterium]